MEDYAGLIERLLKFPMFYRTDGSATWINSGQPEPLCVEAASALTTLTQRLKYHRSGCVCDMDEDGETILKWCLPHSEWKKRAIEAEAKLKQMEDKALPGEDYAGLIERLHYLAMPGGSVAVGSVLLDEAANLLTTLTKDAKRYQWLRVHPAHCANLADNQIYSRNRSKPALFDAAIDAAMEGKADGR